MAVQGKNFKERILDNFNLYENRLNGQKVLEEHKIRVNALKNFEEQGLPTLKNELWKYTNLGFLNNLDFRLDISDSKHSITYNDIDKFKIVGIDNIAVIVNGFFNEKLSNINTNVEIKSLRAARKENANDLELHYNKYLKNEQNVFSSINTALSFDGVFIKVKKGLNTVAPIHIINIVDTNNGIQFKQARNLIIAEDDSTLKIYETNHTIGENVGITNICTEIYLGRNSIVEHIKFQNDTEKGIYFAQIEAKQESDSNYTNTTITLDGKFVRNDLGTTHNGEHIETHYYGYYYGSNRNLIDNHTMIDHATPNCESNELYKGVLSDSSIGTFNGKILVRQDAQKTNAYQSSKNVLLSDSAKVNAKPELEIYADDVKCSHGSSTGSIDQDALFYLQARGIPKDKARALLLFAYSQEIIDKITIEQIRNYITYQIETKFGM
ncbi:Fe-S cluster assembly protein SufD [bacterium]|nr:MAG: Fe-S cluster assembly protein SufD [bacterium]